MYVLNCFILSASVCISFRRKAFCAWKKRTSFPPAIRCASTFLLGTSAFYDLCQQAILKRHLLDVHVYADDKQLYLLFKPGSNVSELEAVTALQNCIIDIKTWMTTDKLKLNDGKTEFIIIGTRAQLDKINITKLSIDQVKVSAVAA